MTTTPLLDRAQRPRERARQPGLVRYLRQQRAARMRHQAASVRHDVYGYKASITHHLQGEPPELDSSPVSKPKNRCSAGRFRAPARPGARGVTARPGLVTIFALAAAYVF